MVSDPGVPRMMRCVAKRVKDKRVLKLIRKYLQAEVMVDGQSEKVRMGVPQGGPISPLLANILLDELDKELELCSVAENIIFEENSA